MHLKSTLPLFIVNISFSVIERKIIDNAGCFENTPKKRVKWDCPLFITLFHNVLFFMNNSSFASLTPLMYKKKS